MPNPDCEVFLTERRLERSAADKDVDSGAVVEFFGVVRQMEDGRQIEGIEYEAHATMAEHQLRQIAKTAAEKFSLFKVRIEHRVGFVQAGEASLFLQVRAGHRGPAFEAGKWIVDELKKRVPIWKRPKFTDADVAAAAVDRGSRNQESQLQQI
jgi:molybdopterin synthase catalytic subunit